FSTEFDGVAEAFLASMRSPGYRLSAVSDRRRLDGCRPPHGYPAVARETFHKSATACQGSFRETGRLSERAGSDFLSRSSSTAPRMTAPNTTSWRNGVTPVRFMPFLMTAMMKAPMSVPNILPSPPERLVPPTTTAAMAYSSYMNPYVGAPLRSREAMTTPPTP